MQIAENEFKTIYRKLSDHFSSTQKLSDHFSSTLRSSPGAVEEQWYDSLRKFGIEPISNWKSLPEPDQYSCVAIFLDSNNILMSNPILGFSFIRIRLDFFDLMAARPHAATECPRPFFWLKIPIEAAEKILVLGL